MAKFPNGRDSRPIDKNSPYSMGSSHSPTDMALRPEQRADVNGKIVTRWVKDGASKSSSGALASHTAVGGGDSNSVPANVNWDAMSQSSADNLARTALEGINDPDKVWSNYDLYTGMLESKHGDLAFKIVTDEKVGPTLRNAWMQKHGVNPKNPDSYQRVEGDEGYSAFNKAHNTFTQAGMAVVLRQDAEGKAKEAADYNFSVQKDQEDREYQQEQIDKRIRAVKSGGKADVEGRVFEWSSLNPFKRGKK